MIELELASAESARQSSTMSIVNRRTYNYLIFPNEYPLRDDLKLMMIMMTIRSVCSDT